MTQCSRLQSVADIVVVSFGTGAVPPVPSLRPILLLFGNSILGADGGGGGSSPSVAL